MPINETPINMSKTGQKIVEENEMNNGALLRAAHKNKNKKLIKYCIEYLKRNISVENAIDIVVSSHITDQKELFDVASKFVIEQKKKEKQGLENWSSQLFGKN